MAIKVQGTTVIDDSRNIINIGVATVGTLDVNKISPDGSDFGQANYVLSSGGSGGSISWQPVTSVGSGTLDGINILEEGVQVGTAGSVVNVNFVGNNVTATAVELGLTATVTLSDTPTYDSLNVSGISTFNGNTKHFDGKYANFGDSADLQIVHDGSNSVIQNATGQLFIDNNASGGDLFLRANDDVIIRVDGNDTVLTAQTGGIDVTGHIETDTLNVSGVSTFTDTVSFGSSAIFGDNDQIIIGDGPDLKLYHDGSHSYIEDSGVGNLKVLTNSFILKNALDNEFLLKATQNSSVELLYDNSKKFETTGYGVTVSGTTQTQQLNVSGLSTFQGDVRITDDDKLRFGTSSGGILQIYTNGNNSFFKQTNGDLKYELADQFIVQKDSGDEPIAIFNSDADVELYHDGSKKFETTGVGVSIVNGTSDTATIYGPSNLIIDPMPIGVGTTSGVVRIKGDLFVDGTTTQINSTTLEIADFIVGVATTATSDLLTDGAGIGIGSDKTFLYEHNGGTIPSLKSSENLNVASGKGYQIDQTEVLSADTLSLGTGTTIHSPGSNRLTFGTNGQERVRINASGNVGIGTDNPNTKLDVAGDISIRNGDQLNAIRTNSAGQLQFLRNSAGNNAVAVTIDDETGNVGIGTDNPAAKLDVDGDIYVGDKIASRQVSLRSTSFLDLDDDNSPGVLGQVGGNNYVTLASISGLNLIFDTNDNDNNGLVIGSGSNDTASATKHMVVSGVGSVGIGTITPTEKLHVEGNALVNGNLYLNDTNYLSSLPTGEYGSVQINGDGKGGWEGYSIDGHAVFMSQGANATFGLWDDTNNHWAILHYRGSNSRTEIRGGNNSANLIVHGTDVRVENVPLIGGGRTTLTGTASQNLQFDGGAYVSGDVGIGVTNPGSTLAVGGTITELYDGSYWNVVTQADVGYGASQVPLNQYLGQLAFLDDHHPNGLRRDGGGSDDVFVDSNGLVGINTTTPTEKLDVIGTVKAIDFDTTSDQNLKTNIKIIEDPLEKIAQIRGVNFEWKENNKPSAGVIAQEVEKVLPELVTNNGTKAVNYNGLIGLLVEAVKAQQKEIDILKSKIK
jgi:hypothetical protein